MNPFNCVIDRRFLNRRQGLWSAGVFILAMALAPSARGAEADSVAAVLPDSLAPAGNVVYVDFWASWCVPCRKSLPWLGQLQKSRGADGLTVMTINVDKERKAADAFLQSLGTPLDVVYDPKGVIAERCRLEVMPTSLIYGRDGRLRRRHEGFSPADTIEIAAFVDSLLSEAKTK